jgi:uncharacterized repeat protein (TIGR04138 family)
MALKKALDTIQKRLIDSGRDSRYTIEAYNFVLNGLEFYLTKIGEKRHVTGQELTAGLCEFAQKQFGPLAYRVLTSWGIRESEDFGYLVYNLIECGLMSKRESDSLDDFFNVMNIEDYFKNQDCFTIDPDYIKSIKGA